MQTKNKTLEDNTNFNLINEERDKHSDGLNIQDSCKNYSAAIDGFTYDCN